MYELETTDQESVDEYETDALAELADTEGVHPKSLERARTEPMAFNVPSEGLVVVANERHDEPGDHTYAVNIDDGLPVVCSCPADTHYRGACKHRVAVALHPAILAAATVDKEKRELVADGGVAVPAVETPGSDDENGCPHGRDYCEGANAPGRPELCWECWDTWASETHDFSDEVATDTRVRDMIEADRHADDVERAVVEAFERGIR